MKRMVALCMIAMIFFGGAFYFGHLSKNNTLYIKDIELQSDELLEYTEENPEDLSANLSLAELYLNQGKKDLAINLLEEVLEQSPGYSDGLYLLTIAYYENGNYVESINVAEELLKHNNYQPNVLLHLASLYYLTGNETQFVYTFKKSLEAYELTKETNEFEDYYNDLNSFIVKFEELRKNEKYVDSYLTIAQNERFDFTVRSYSYEKADVESGYTLSEEDLIDKGIIDLHFNRDKRAIESFERILENDCNNEYAKFLIIDTLNRNGNTPPKYIDKFDSVLHDFYNISVKMNNNMSDTSLEDYKILDQIFTDSNGPEKQVLSFYLMKLAENLKLKEEYVYYSEVFFSGEFDELYLVSLY